MVTKHKWPKKHLPNAVQQNCGKFQEQLTEYHSCLQGVAERHLLANPEVVRDARQVWNNLARQGRQLLETGKLWNMDDWVRTHPEYRQFETAGFFEDLRDQKRMVIPGEGMAWGIDLKRLLWWFDKTRRPPGFPKHQYKDNVDELNSVIEDPIEEVFEDVNRDVQALLVAANEQLADKTVLADARLPLSDREEAVLDVIPYAETSRRGMTGKEIIKAVAKKDFKIGASDLRKNIIPRLRAYGVENRPGVGYFRRR